MQEQQAGTEREPGTSARDGRQQDSRRGRQEPYQRLEGLRSYLRELGSVAVALSGGVDSAFLAKVAHDTLGTNMLALTARMRGTTDADLASAEELCRRQGIPHAYVDFDELEIPGFADNGPSRCYLCRNALFSELKMVADAHDLLFLAEGSDQDDLDERRPGLRALSELGIKSPLRRAHLTRADVRRLSREMGLPTWDRPASACLSTRVAYGLEVTPQLLRDVAAAEDDLRELGFRDVRVRVHPAGGHATRATVARIEVPEGDVDRLMRPQTRRAARERLSERGFAYVTVDLAGLEPGSMDRMLDDDA